MEPIELRSDARHKLIAATPGQVFAAIAAPERIAKWWGPAGFTNTIHKFDFVPGGQWLLTMHGPDGKNYPNESRFLRLEPGRIFEVEHTSNPHFILTLEFSEAPDGALVYWRQTFDSVEQFQSVSAFVAVANEQNLERLAQEVAAVRGAA
jgi:uncharacterized protein YndB with AHSA1/START domain